MTSHSPHRRSCEWRHTRSVSAAALLSFVCVLAPCLLINCLMKLLARYCALFTCVSPWSWVHCAGFLKVFSLYSLFILRFKECSRWKNCMQVAALACFALMKHKHHNIDWFRRPPMRFCCCFIIMHINILGFGLFYALSHILWHMPRLLLWTTLSF